MPKDLANQEKTYTPIFGTAVTPIDDEIIYAPWDADPKDVMRLIETGAFKAIIIPPENRAQFISEMNAMSQEELKAIDHNSHNECEFKSEFDSEETLVRLHPFIQKVIKRIAPYLHASSRKEIQGVGFGCMGLDEPPFPYFHHDDLVFHVSLRGHALQFLAGHLSEQDKKELAAIERECMRRIYEGDYTDRLDIDPKWKSRMFSVQQGDLVIFNKKFFHRSPWPASENGQLTFAVS